MNTILIHRKYKFPKACNVEEMVMRETSGIDEQQAALAADAHGEGTSILQELIKLAIVEVDGIPVAQPFVALTAYNSKTRALIMKAFEDLNDLKDEEIEVFLKASQDATPGLAPPTMPEQGEPEPVASGEEEASSNTAS